MTAITCAATNDITAWSILALIVAVASSGALLGVLITVVLSLIFVSVMLFVIRPFLNKVALKHTARETVSTTIVALVLSTMLISSYITEVIGIHALFGAFIAGVIIPDNARFKQIIAEKIQDVSMVLLLPLFFVYTGLRTQIGLLNEPELWLTVLLVIGVAVTGKFAGSALAARFTGQSWKDSLVLGALLNTRGLFELVALNIGYDMGILSPEIFTILVLMALATAFMTGPFISLINYLSREPDAEQSVFGLLKVLIAFGPSESGGRLTLMVNSLFGNRKNYLKITALHLTPNTEISIEDARHYEDEAFHLVREVAADAGIQVKTIYRTTENVSMEIIKAANRGKFDLLLVGSSRPLLSHDETGGKARYFFDKAKCDVGLFIDKGFEKICNILVIMETNEESYLQELAGNFNPECRIDLACLLPLAVPVKGVQIPEYKPVMLENLEGNFSSYDLIISTLNCYRNQREAGATWIDGTTSILLISQGGMH
jgi:nucleotide-binding universal stress UspA family protein